MIKGMQVIRANPTSHSLDVLPGEKIDLTYGDSLRVITSLEYKGPMVSKATLFGTIGEKVAGEVEVDFPKADVFTPWIGSVDIPITADIEPGVEYDLSCKIKEYPEAGTAKVNRAIDIIGIPPTYDLLEHTIYPYAYIYEGDCDILTFTFKTDPFSPSGWVAGKLATTAEKEVRKEGGKVLEIRVYADKNALLWTDWRVEVVGIPSKTIATAGMSTGLVWWGVAIIAALVVIGIIAATLLVKEIAGIFKRKVGLDDVKVAWGKETLSMTIQDAEDYWERTPTPPETLDSMSEEDLRHLLNKIAAEEVPVGMGWLPWAIIGGVAVIGAGAAVALSQRKK